MSERVFISYRRSDTEHLAGRIADRLRTVKEIDRVFIDVNDIAPGEDFETKIDTAIADSTVCLLIIGQDWLGRDLSKQPSRIFDNRDFIRLETRAILNSGKKVLPVLADEAQMPSKEELPKDLNQLPRINAFSMRHLHFDRDVESLLETFLDQGKKTNPGEPSIFSLFFRWFGGFFLAIAGLILTAIIHSEMTGGRSLEESLGGQAEVWLLILGILAFGAALPFAARWYSKTRHKNSNAG